MVFFRSTYRICSILRKQQSSGFLWSPHTNPSSNLGGTIFRVSGHNFHTKFWHNSRTVNRTVSASSPSCFPSNFTSGCCTWVKIYETCKSSKMALREFFCFDLKKLFHFEETAVMMVFKVAEFESVHKIRVAPFLESPGTSFEGNFGQTWRR